MKKLMILVLVSILASMAVFGPHVVFAASPAFLLSAPNGTVTDGQELQITLEGKNLMDLYAYEAVISFDASKHEFVRAVSGLKGFSVAPKVEGNRVYIAFTKIGNAKGTAGDALLSTLSFRGKGRGTSTVKLETVKAVDSKLASQNLTPQSTLSLEIRGVSFVQEPVVNRETGQATSSLAMETIEDDLLPLAVANPFGIKTVEIEIAHAEGVREYVQKFPIQALREAQLQTWYNLSTPLGTIRIPGNMMTGIGAQNAKTVSILITRANTADFPSALRAEIGDRPVITLKVAIDDRIVAWNNPQATVQVTIPYAPDAEEAGNPEHIVVWHIDGQKRGNPVETGVYLPLPGGVRFQTNHFSTFAVSFVQITFDDIKNHWSRRYVDVMASRGIIKGMPGKIYGHAQSITRADYVTLLVRMLGLTDTVETNFEDVRPDAYFYQTVGIAKKMGIVGDSGKKFNPREPITREDMMVYTAAALKHARPETKRGNPAVLQAFSDTKLVSPEAIESTAVLVEAEIIIGADGKLMPKRHMSRAEAATVLYRLFETLWID